MFGRPGVFLAAVCVLAGCEGVGEDRPMLELGQDTVQLERGTTLVDFRLEDGIAPDSAVARAGDVVRFTAADGLTHAVAFDEPALSPKVRAFLDETEQLRGPPLVDEGSAWVVSLEGAPPGVYPFVCMTHEARGVLIVHPPER